MWMPGTEVGMAWNGPPVSVPGLGSQVSSWLTPPGSQMTSTRFCGRLQLLGRGRLDQAAEAEHARAAPAATPAEEPAPRERVLRRVAGVEQFMSIPPRDSLLSDASMQRSVESMIEPELRRRQQGPGQLLQRGRPVRAAVFR